MLWPLQCEMTTQDEVVGKVHEGFYAALFYHSKESDGKKFDVAAHALFRCICEKLADAVGDNKSLYVTGHSLGEPPGTSSCICSRCLHIVAGCL